MSKKKRDHFLGKRSGWGYGVHGENEYAPAPCITATMDQLVTEEQGIRKLLEATHDYASRRLSAIADQKRRWWEETMADIGVSKETHDASYLHGVVTVKAKKTPEPKSESPS